LPLRAPPLIKIILAKVNISTALIVVKRLYNI